MRPTGTETVGAGNRVLIGLGANLGDPIPQLARAVALLRERVEIRAISSVYRSEPVGYQDQPDFFNLVIEGVTERTPAELLGDAQEIENGMGRVRPFPGAPRTIDIDLLDHGGAVLESPELVLPHPRLHERGFVLYPLAEISPEWRHPRFAATAAQLIEKAGRTEWVERWGALPGSRIGRSG